MALLAPGCPQPSSDACAGATTTSLATGGQLKALDENTELVTLSIGGNYIGWSSAVVACLGGTDQQCAGALAAVRNNVVTQLPGLLDDVIPEAVAEQGFQFVDVTERFLGHGVNAPEPWILGPFDPGAFHPSSAGYQAYTAAVTAAIIPARLR